MHKFVSSLLIVALLGVLMLLPVKSEAYISTVVVAVAPAGPIGPVIAGILIGVSVLLTFLGLGGPDCDDLAKKFLSVPNINSIRGENRDFGGRVTEKMKCECKTTGGVNQVFIVGDPRGALIGATAQSKIYDHKALNIGNWVLGKTTSKKVCDVPEAYEIDFIGTSK